MPVIDPPFWTHHPLVGMIPALSLSPWGPHSRQKTMSLSNAASGGVFRSEPDISLASKTDSQNQDCPECRGRVSGPSFHDGSGDNRCAGCKGETREKGAYASTQIDLPNVAASNLAQLAAIVRAEDLADDGIERESHITIKYGLLCRAESVQAAVKDFPPVEYEVGGFRVFEHDDKPDVLYLAVTSRDLIRLNRVLSDLPCKPDDHPEYTPHATIAYVKAGTGAVYAAALNGVLDLRMKGVARQFVFSDPDRRLTTIMLNGVLADSQMAGMSLPALGVPGDEVREKGSGLVRAVLAEGTPEQLDGLTVWYSETGPRYWIDLADWHESGFGNAVIKAAEEELGCEAKESNQFESEPEKGVYVSNESGPKDADDWDRIYPPKEREKAADDHHEFMDEIAEEAVALLGGHVRQREKSWDEQKHPRGDGGKWIEGGAGVHSRVSDALKAGHTVRIGAGKAAGRKGDVNAKIVKVDGEHMIDSQGRRWNHETLAANGARLLAFGGQSGQTPSPAGQQAGNHDPTGLSQLGGGAAVENMYKMMADHLERTGELSPQEKGTLADSAWQMVKKQFGNTPDSRARFLTAIKDSARHGGYTPAGVKASLNAHFGDAQKPKADAPVERHNPALDDIMNSPPAEQPKADESKMRHNPALDDLFDPKPPASPPAPSPTQPAPSPPVPVRTNPRPIPAASPDATVSAHRTQPGQVTQRVDKSGNRMATPVAKRMATPIPLPPKMAKRAIPVAKRLADKASKSPSAKGVLQRADRWAERVGAAYADRVVHKFPNRAKAAKALAAVIRHLCRAANASGELASANVGGHKFTVTRKRQKGFDPDNLFTPFDPVVDDGTNSSPVAVEPDGDICPSCGSNEASPFRSPVYQLGCDGCGAKFSLSKYGQAKGYPVVMPVGLHAVTNHTGRFVRAVPIQIPEVSSA